MTGQTPPSRPVRKPGSTRKLQCATSPAAVVRAARGKRILDYRRKGLALRAIAEKLKISKTEVQRILVREIAAIGSTQESKVQVRALQLDRLDVWLAGLWSRTARGDEKAITTALKIEERRAKLLGTDAPVEQRIKLTVLGQINWIFDIIKAELGEDAAKRVVGRIGAEGGPPADSDLGDT
jgi:hypothetical protein